MFTNSPAKKKIKVLLKRSCFGRSLTKTWSEPGISKFPSVSLRPLDQRKSTVLIGIKQSWRERDVISEEGGGRLIARRAHKTEIDTKSGSNAERWLMARRRSCSCQLQASPSPRSKYSPTTKGTLKQRMPKSIYQLHRLRAYKVPKRIRVEMKAFWLEIGKSL